MSARQRAKDFEEQLSILTRRAFERWSIVITMLEMTIRKIKNGKEFPVLLRPWEIDDAGHQVGSIRNAIDVMKRTSPPVVKAHEEEVDFYEVRFTIHGIDYLLSELNLWDEIAKLATIDILKRSALEIIRKLLDELKRLLEGSVPKKT